MSKQFKYTIRLLPTEYHITFYIGPDIRPIHKHFNGTLTHDFTNDDGFFVTGTEQQYAIAIEKYNDGLLIHEISHLIDYWFKEIGADDGEFRAYWMQLLFIQVKGEYKKWKKKK